MRSRPILRFLAGAAALWAVLSLGACSSTEEIDDSNTAGTSGSGAAGSSAMGGTAGKGGGTSGGGTSGGTNAGGSIGAGGDAALCSDVPVAQLCVVGTPIDSGDALAVGDKLTVRVTPGGCLSSSCTRVDVARCTITGAGPDFTAEGEFCLADTGGPGTACTADCGGGGFADCESEVTLSAGEYSVTLGDLSVTFTVPGTLGPGEGCDGTRF
jgi:hypothetical protein